VTARHGVAPTESAEQRTPELICFAIQVVSDELCGQGREIQWCLWTAARPDDPPRAVAEGDMLRAGSQAFSPPPHRPNACAHSPSWDLFDSYFQIAADSLID